MMRKTKKLVSFLLSVLMLTAMIPAVRLTVRADDKLLGDPTGDKIVSSADARLIYRAAVKLDPEETCMDIDKKNGVNMADVRYAMRIASGLAGLSSFADDLSGYRATSLDQLDSIYNDSKAFFDLEIADLTENEITVALVAKNCVGLQSADLVIEYDDGSLQYQTDEAASYKNAEKVDVFSSELNKTEKGILKYTLYFPQSLLTQAEYAAQGAPQEIPGESLKLLQVTFERDALLSYNFTVGIKDIGGILATSKKITLTDPAHTAAHKTENVPAQKAACTEDGYTDGVYCAECKKFVSGHAVIPATGHMFAEPILAADATCSAPGLTADTCIVCGEVVCSAIGKPPHTDADHDSVCDVCGTALDGRVGLELTENFDGKIRVALVAYGCAGMNGGDPAFTYDPAVLRFIDCEPGRDAALSSAEKKDAFAFRLETPDEKTLMYSFYFSSPPDGSLGEDFASFELAYFSFEVVDPEAASAQFGISDPGIAGLSANPPLVAELRHTPVGGTEREIAAATCKRDGVKTYTCASCGLTVAERIPATGLHTWNEGEITRKAACNAEGEKTFTCAVCGETKTEAVPKTEHTWDAGSVTVKATCKAAGEKTFTCAVCGETKTEAVPKLTEHTWDEGKVTEEPALGADGEKTFTCTVCGATKKEVIQGLPDFPSIYTDHAREKGDYVYALAGTKAGEILNDVGVNGVRKPDGSEVKAEDILASGMTVSKANEVKLTVVILGDVNGDGRITAADARLALRQAVGLEKPDGWQKAAAMVTGGDKVNAKDARKILRITVGLDQPVLMAE